MFLVLLCGASIHGGAVSISQAEEMYEGTSVCNNCSTISEWLDENEEFLMDSETSKRHLLATKSTQTITYPPTYNPNQPACKGNPAYRDCLPDRNPSDRGCKTAYGCRH